MVHTPQGVHDFVLLLAQAEHDARLGDDALLAPHVLDVLQHLETLPEGGPPVADIRRQALDGLDVVCVDIKTALGDNLDHVEVASEVARQGLDQQRGLLVLNLADRLGEMPRAAVDEVVAVDAGEDDVAQAPAGEGLSRVLGLVGVEGRGRAARLDAAEAAAAGARIAHEHDGGRGGALVGAAPALRDVGAARLLADRVQAEPAQVRLDLLVVVVARGDGRLEPLGQPRDGALLARGADLGGAQRVRLRGRQRLRGRRRAHEVGKRGHRRVFEIRLSLGLRGGVVAGVGDGGKGAGGGGRGAQGPPDGRPGALERRHSGRAMWCSADRLSMEEVRPSTVLMGEV